MRKVIKRLVFACVNTWVATRKHYKRNTWLKHSQMFRVILDLTPPLSTQLHHRWALAHVREYVWTICALASSTHVTPFDKTIWVLRFLHSFFEVDLPPFIDNFHIDMEVTLNWKTFIYALACSPHLFFGGPLGMVYEFLQDYFVPNDSINGFNLFFKVCGHITQGHVPPSILSLFFAFQLLVSEK